MTRPGPIETLPLGPGAVWIAAALAVLAVAVAALSPGVLQQHRLSRWKIPASAVHWIPAAPSSLPRLPVEGEATRTVSKLPFGPSAPVQMSYRFRMPSVGDASLAVLAPRVDGQAALYANGAPVRSAAEPAAASPSGPTARPRLWLIPPGYLHAGENRIDIIITGAAMRSLASPLYVGPEPVLAPLAASTAKLAIIARQLLLGLTILAMSANLIAAVVRGPPYHLAVAALFAATATRLVIADAAPIAGPFWPIIDQLLVAATALCAAAAFRAAWPPRTRLRRGAEAGLLALAGLLGVGSLLAAGLGATGAVLIGSAAIAVSVVYLMWLIIEAAPGAASARPGQIIVGCAVGLGAAVAVFVLPGATGLPPAGTPFVADAGLLASLGAAALLATGVGGLEAVRRLHAYLRVRLDQAGVIQHQQMALEATALALDETTRQSAVLEERQRMARDVHDGIGGQLASLIAQVRLRRVSMDQIEETLVGGLSELRLLVDSLDVVGESLADVLTTFVVRVRQQVAAAGMQLEWNQPPDLVARIRDPQWVLNLYRLMQEAITNAVRHSGGAVISVTIETVDTNTLSVRIRDDGRSFDFAAVSGGRGLANMAHRAKTMGGTFALRQVATGQGTIVCVDAPIPVQAPTA